MYRRILYTVFSDRLPGIQSLCTMLVISRVHIQDYATRYRHACTARCPHYVVMVPRPVAVHPKPAISRFRRFNLKKKKTECEHCSSHDHRTVEMQLQVTSVLS